MSFRKNTHLTDEGAMMLEESFDLTREAINLLGMVVDEWDSDPTSVACFDLRIVKRAKEVVERLKVVSIIY